MVPVNVLRRFQMVTCFNGTARISFVQRWLTRKDKCRLNGIERTQLIMLFKRPVRRVNGFRSGCVSVIVLCQRVSPAANFRTSVSRRLAFNGEGVPDVVP